MRNGNKGLQTWEPSPEEWELARLFGIATDYNEAVSLPSSQVLSMVREAYCLDPEQGLHMDTQIRRGMFRKPNTISFHKTTAYLAGQRMSAMWGADIPALFCDPERPVTLDALRESLIKRYKNLESKRTGRAGDSLLKEMITLARGITKLDELINGDAEKEDVRGLA